MGSQENSSSDATLVLSGGAGKQVNSARAGFLPIAIERVPVAAFVGIPVYVRAAAGQKVTEGEVLHGQFALYRAESVRFSEADRRRLMEYGIKFLYIPIAQQSRFRIQMEEQIDAVINDPMMAIAEKSGILYETSVELVNEMLADPEGVLCSPRLLSISKAVTTLVMDNDRAFTHLFAASHHDFYTATHMVNVATWMVPLAYAIGHRDPEELNQICQAGLMHDMGKIHVPESILNKSGKLTDEDWAQIRTHPEAGVKYLSQFEGVHPLVLTVTAQHHERLDGTGYPAGLKNGAIHPISRICAVVDSFDAMTAFRPFKQRTMTVDEAVAILKRETPEKYDPEVVAAWIGLLESAEVTMPGRRTPAMPPKAPADDPESVTNRRAHERQKLHCHGRVHQLVRSANGIEERPAMAMVAHSISRGGLGLLTQSRIEPGEFVRVFLQATGWENRALEGHVVRCRTYEDRWMEIGVAFGDVEVDALPWKSSVAA